jgi:uncharacterized membrane protein SpoIIM required for sporulation
MKQVDFERRLSPEWLSIDQWMDKSLGRGRGISTFVRRMPIKIDGDVPILLDQNFPAAYRRLCQQLALAQTRMYSQTLIDFLQDLVHRGHSIMYRPKPSRLATVMRFLLIDFPGTVRKHGKTMMLACLLFYGPFFLMIGLVHWKPDIALNVLGPEMMGDLQSMYNPKNDKMGRTAGTDLQMFGHYIMNNISIGFRTFASGFFGGIGAILVLLYNGIFIGAAAGHLTQIGFGGPFWRFVVGHSGPELMAIAISGGAGLQLGLALLMPGQKSYGRALIDAGKDGAILMFGVFIMLLAAAFIEAFWSSQSSLPNFIKYGSGLSLWALIIVWLLYSGRGREMHAS